MCPYQLHFIESAPKFQKNKHREHNEAKFLDKQLREFQHQPVGTEQGFRFDARRKTPVKTKVQRTKASHHRCHEHLLVLPETLHS
tara:strand:- start:60 stop:314 length:255 start_codon:yes stop_codon:yes gene_type:complete